MKITEEISRYIVKARDAGDTYTNIMKTIKTEFGVKLSKPSIYAHYKKFTNTKHDVKVTKKTQPALATPIVSEAEQFTTTQLAIEIVKSNFNKGYKLAFLEFIL